ncbi:MAG: crossover junction endodeoxyribonuclease RuvC [Dehalococcoidia bacterium]
MRIIGIDPGLNVTGIGVIEVEGDRCRHVHHSVLRTKPAEPLAARLLLLRDGVRDAARAFATASGAVETSFVSNNARSAMMLGHARAAAILGLADAGVAVHEYSPNLIKQTVTGYGHGEKSQVAQMVRMQLGLAAIPSPADAADALAIAITHWAHTRLERRM